MSTGVAHLVVDIRADHGEGPVWDAANGRLLWVDLTACKLHAFDPATGAVETRTFEEPVCAAASHADGRLLVAFAKRLAWVDWKTGVAETICEVEPDMPGNRCNDGKRDPAGRFWIGTMSIDGEAKGAGALYRLDQGVRITRVLDQLTIANGMGWSRDSQTMYFIDSPTREILAFDFDCSDSSIRNRRTVVRVPDGLGIPDGMEVGSDDTLWVAHWGAGCVCQWCPKSGRLLQRVDTGCPHTSSCCFSDEGHLYITTSRLGLDVAALAAHPRSGGLFRHNPIKTSE